MAAICLLVFGFVAWQVKTHDVLAFDTTIRQWFYGLRSELTNPIGIVITYLGNWQTIVSLVGILLMLPATRIRMGLPVAVTAGVSTGLYKVLKMLFGRPRPDQALHLVTESGLSFPSGHSMNGLVAYGMIIWLLHRYYWDRAWAKIISALLAVLIFAIGLSRIFVGVHYPSDVAGGWSFGFGFLSLATLLWEAGLPPKKEGSTRSESRTSSSCN